MTEADFDGEWSSLRQPQQGAEPTTLLRLACALIHGLIGEPQESAILPVFVARISLLDALALAGLSPPSHGPGPGSGHRAP